MIRRPPRSTRTDTLFPYTTLFRSDRTEARRRIGVPEDALVLLFAANRARVSPFKDYGTVRAAAIEVERTLPQRRVLLLALGDSGPDEKVGNTELRFVPYQSEEAVVASFYHAADIYQIGRASGRERVCQYV